jgi:protein-S-isoprenylcysteine O-methyltransferase Ste14
MTAPYLEIVAACWVVLAVYWAWGAGQTRPAKQVETLASSAVSGVLMWMGSVLLSASAVRPHLVAVASLAPSPVRQIVGTALVALGVAFAIWSRIVLGSNWSRVARISEGQRLVESGPYRIVRNPIYSGFLLAVFGMALASGSVVAFAGLLLVFAGLWRKARVEERLLAAEFGDEYVAYAKRVKSIIPFVL